MSDYFKLLEAELSRVAAPGTRRRRPARRVLAIAAAVALLAGVPAAAVTGGALSGKKHDAREVSRFLHQKPIAEGTASNGARWQLLASEGDKGFCFGILMPSRDPGELAPGGGVGCGDRRPGVLFVSSASGGPGKHYGPRHSLALGTAPDAAVAVEISVGKGKLTVPTFDDPKGIRGRFYVTGIPTRWLRPRKHVRALDANGRVIARAGG
jgi:hypothetical protein